MEEEKSNRSCPLYGTLTCDRLNMRACRSCPAWNKTPREADYIREDVETLYDMLPPEGVDGLFAGDDCTLCKSEKKGKKDCYALYDMGHDDPRTGKKKVSLFRGKIYGFVIPLQFNCCRDCRRRFQLLGWLPLLTTILILGTTLLIVSHEPAAQGLRTLWRGLPLVLLLAAGILGYGVGRLLQGRLRERFNQATYMDLNDHPLVRRMNALGWEGLVENTKYPQPVFTRKRLTHGVGTAATGLPAEKNGDHSENLD